MTQTRQTENREYGLDLLRVLSMLMVILLHVLGHGGLKDAYAPDSGMGALLRLVEIAVYPAVDCFVLLSGYLLCCQPFKPSRFVKVWMPAFFWSVLIQCIFFLLNPETISPGTVLYMFLPVLSGRYWFLNAYLVMLLAGPALNNLLRNMPKWHLRGLLLVTLGVFCVAPVLAMGNDVFKTQSGYAFPWFLVLYLWGGYIRLHRPAPEKKWKPLLGYFLLVVFHWLWVQAAQRLLPHMAASGIFMKYTSVPVFGSAICLLQFFRSLQIPEKSGWARLLKTVSPCVFCVYLIHDHPLTREALMKGSFSAAGQLPDATVMLWATGAVIGIFALCICLERLRNRVFRLLGVDMAVNKICGKLTDRIVTLLKGDL